jgi:hypothetical protein
MKATIVDVFVCSVVLRELDSVGGVWIFADFISYPDLRVHSFSDTHTNTVRFFLRTNKQKIQREREVSNGIKFSIESSPFEYDIGLSFLLELFIYWCLRKSLSSQSSFISTHW